VTVATEAKLSTALIKGLNRSGCFVYKASDRFTLGVSDIAGVTPGGLSLAVESKLVSSWPKRGSSRALSRALTFQQVKFLDEVGKRGGVAIVAIGYPSEKRGIDVQVFDVHLWKQLSIDESDFCGENISVDTLKKESGTVLSGSLSGGFDWPHSWGA